MPDAQTMMLFLVGALVLNFTPGPDMAFTLAVSARAGTRSGIAAALGVGVGSFGWAMLTAFGLATLLAASEHALTIIQILGGGYLVFLAIQTYRKRHEQMISCEGDDKVGAFGSGLITNLFNPKVGLFFLAFLPGFTDPAVGPVWRQTLILGGIFSVTGALVLIAVAVAAGLVRNKLTASPAIGVRLNSLAALMFAALGVYLIGSIMR